MADNDRYQSDDNRDRLGQRDVFMDNRTGIGAQRRGYRAEWGRGRDERYGDRDENYNQPRAENASFRDRDHGQPEGGRTGYRGRDDDSRYGGGNQNYMQGDRYGTSNPSYSRGAGQGGGRYGRDESWQSYPARSNPDFYADENGAAGPGWAEDFSGRNRGPETYRGQSPGQNRYAGGPEVRRSSQTYEADYERHRPGHEHDGQDRGWWDKAADKVAAWFGGDDSQGSPYESRGSHRGKGPKNYRRSDDRIREDVSDRLTDDHWLDASDVEVNAKDGEVTLSGMVKTRDDKRRAEQLAEQVSGVDNVLNNLRVQRQDEVRAGQPAETAVKAGGSTAFGASPPASEFGSTSEGTTTSNMGDLSTPGSIKSGKTTQ